MDKQSEENLDGWWHAFFDAAALPAQLEPSVGWQGIDDHKESTPVPGAFSLLQPGHGGVVWYHRPFVLPEWWGKGEVWLECAARSRVQVFLDETPLSTVAEESTVAVRLGRLLPLRVYNLCLKVWHQDDSGGIISSVTLVYRES